MMTKWHIKKRRSGGAQAVKRQGDRAVLHYTEFDQQNLKQEDLRVSSSEDAAYQQVSKN